MAEKLFLSAGEFARKIGVCKNTLANYESKGILLPHHKNLSGYRYYTPEQVDEYFNKLKGVVTDGSSED